MNGAIDSYIESSEEEQETPLGHRLARAGLATVIGILASWGAERMYNSYLNRNNQEIESDVTSDTQE